MSEDALILSAGFVVGASLGSFLALVADRWPRGEAIVMGRSCCRGCGRRLPSTELVPVASYLLQRGRCRHCDVRIGPEALAAELGGGVVAALALACAATPAGALALALMGWTLLLLALLDWQWLWLPDRLTLPLLAGGLALSPVLPAHGLADRAAGAAFGFAALALVRAGYRALRGREGMGAGDAKLLAAIGAWLGLASLPFVVLGAALGGLALAALFMVRRRDDIATMRLPLGTFLAVAAVVLMPLFG